MIPIKTHEEIKKMRRAGKIASKLLKYIEEFIFVGQNTEKINNLCEEFTRKHGAISAPLNYRGFPKSICTSINNVVCHGIPSKIDVLEDGDIINVDVTVIKDEYHADTSKTFFVGNVNPETKLLVERTKKAMMKAIEVIKPNIYLNEIGKTIEKYISKFDYGIVQDFTGHGIGKKFHEEPQVCHYDMGSNGPRLQKGMVFTIEPMINATSNFEVYVDKDDNWTVYTSDTAISAQFEHTVLVTDSSFEILTL